MIYSADFRHATWTAYISTFTLQIPSCYMESVHFNHYYADSRHATWTAYILTFILQFTSILHGQPTFQHLLCRFPPCYMDSLHFNIYFSDSPRCYMDSVPFNIYSPHYHHATCTVYISTFTLQLPPYFIDRLLFNI